MTNLKYANNSSQVEVELDRLLSESILDNAHVEPNKMQEQGTASSLGVQLHVVSNSQTIFTKSYGKTNSLSLQGKYGLEDLADNAVFDLGSLTSVVTGSLIIYLLAQEGLLTYENRISRYLPSFGTLGKERMTIGHFVSHTSGLPSVSHLSRSIMQASSRDKLSLSRRVALDKLLKELIKVKIANLPGKFTEESQLGYILLMYVIEQVTGLSVDKLFKKLIARPLGLRSLDYIDWELLKRERVEPDLKVIVPTKSCPWRKKLIHGECCDELAWYLSGVSTHSGLFGTLEDLGLVGQSFLDGFKGSSLLFRGIDFESKFDEFLVQNNASREPAYNLLGLIREASSSNSGSDNFWYGLDGDTGVSLWLAPEIDTVVVLATTDIQRSKDLTAQRELSRKVKNIITEYTAPS